MSEFLTALPAQKREVAEEALAFIRKHIPKGYQEQLSLGMLTWSVPLDVLPDTYNGQPLWYLALAATKNGFSLYLMSVYGDAGREDAFRAAYKKAGKKLDLGKACLRFKTMDDLVLPAVQDAITSMPMKRYVEAYRTTHAKSKNGR